MRHALSARIGDSNVRKRTRRSNSRSYIKMLVYVAWQVEKGSGTLSVNLPFFGTANKTRRRCEPRLSGQARDAHSARRLGPAWSGWPRCGRAQPAAAISGNSNRKAVASSKNRKRGEWRTFAPPTRWNHGAERAVVGATLLQGRCLLQLSGGCALVDGSPPGTLTVATC
jgi:hypothetical protein